MQQVEQYHKQVATQFILLQILETRHFNIMVIQKSLKLKLLLIILLFQSHFLTQFMEVLQMLHQL